MNKKTESPLTVSYEPPRLTRVGSLRDLLGKSGTYEDNSQNFSIKSLDNGDGQELQP
jgi:hypothetical protein